MKILLLVCLMLPGCMPWIATPPFERNSAAGQARAWSQPDADRIAAELERSAPKVRLLLASTRGAPRVFVDREEIPGLPDAVTYRTLIVLGKDAAEQEEMLLVHELAHWYIGGVGEQLPLILEEGVADMVTGEVLPEWSLSIRALHAHFLRQIQSLPDPAAMFRIQDSSAWKGRSETEARALRAMGYALATRIGLDGLRELCAEARARGLAHIPPERLFERVRIDPLRLEDWTALVEFPPEFPGSPVVRAPDSLPPGKCLKITFYGADGSVLRTTLIPVFGSCQVPRGTSRQLLEIVDCPANAESAAGKR